MKLFDTHLQPEKVKIEIFKKMSPEKRLEMAIEFTKFVKNLIKEGIKKRHPEYSEKEIKLAVIKVILGEKLFRKAYPEYTKIKP